MQVVGIYVVHRHDLLDQKLSKAKAVLKEHHIRMVSLKLAHSEVQEYGILKIQGAKRSLKSLRNDHVWQDLETECDINFRKYV